METPPANAVREIPFTAKRSKVTPSTPLRQTTRLTASNGARTSSNAKATITCWKKKSAS